MDIEFVSLISDIIINVCLQLFFVIEQEDGSPNLLRFVVTDILSTNPFRVHFKVTIELGRISYVGEIIVRLCALEEDRMQTLNFKILVCPSTFTCIIEHSNQISQRSFKPYDNDG